jgi:hypothetical protein
MPAFEVQAAIGARKQAVGKHQFFDRNTEDFGKTEVGCWNRPTKEV